MLVYRIENNLNGKVYIGQTTRTLEIRLAGHMSPSSPSLIGKAIRKYGLANFTTSTVYETDNINDLNEAEIRWISLEDCMVPNGYNMAKGGYGTVGYHHTIEAKLKMSKHWKGKRHGADNNFYGKHHSEDTKARWREQRSGRTLTETHRNNIAEANKVKVRNVTTGEIFNSVQEASIFAGVRPTNITKNCRGRSKSSGGYVWEYLSPKTIPCQDC